MLTTQTIKSNEPRQLSPLFKGDLGDKNALLLTFPARGKSKSPKAPASRQEYHLPRKARHLFLPPKSAFALNRLAPEHVI